MVELSIVCPSYNKATHLRRHLQSLQAQTFPHDEFEVLILDDGSTDATKRVVDEARKLYDFSVRYWFLNRPGRNNPALAWNVGIAHAAADTIVSMGADLIAAHDALSLLADYMAKSDGYAYVFGNCYQVHSRMAEAMLDHLPWQQDIHVLESAFITPFHHSSYWHVPMLAAVPKARLVEIGGYDESYAEPYPEDEDCWVRLEAMGVYAVNVPDVWGAHQYHQQVDPLCYKGCSCPLWQKSGTWAHRGAKYDGLPEDILRNRAGWGQLPEGSYEA